MKTLPFVGLIVAAIVGVYFLFFWHGDISHAHISGPPPSEATASAPKVEKSLEDRVRVLDEYVTKDGTPQLAAVVSPVLAHRASKEFSSRIPTAQKQESQIRFVSDRFAIVSIAYVLPGDRRTRTQEIHFLFSDDRWNQFWIAEGKNG